MPKNPFQEPCTNCGCSDGIQSLQAWYLNQAGKPGNQEFGFDVLGQKLNWSPGNFNPYARFLQRQQPRWMTLLSEVFALTSFLSGVLLIVLVPTIYAFFIAAHLKNGKPIFWQPLLILPAGVSLLVFGRWVREDSKRLEAKYWEAFEAMALVPVCKCGKTLSELPTILKG